MGLDKVRLAIAAVVVNCTTNEVFHTCPEQLAKEQVSSIVIPCDPGDLSWIEVKAIDVTPGGAIVQIDSGFAIGLVGLPLVILYAIREQDKPLIAPPWSQRSPMVTR